MNDPLAAKFERAATGALLRKSFDVILAFLCQMLFFQVVYNIMHFMLLFSKGNNVKF